MALNKQFKGKALYNPSGKAGEYSYWACNFYNGCSNGCTYCYLKKGILSKTMGGDRPTLKKCFKDEEHAIEVFEKELQRNLLWEKTENIENGLKSNGLFFSFTTDPMIAETKRLTIKAVHLCNKLNIPVKILTKETGYLYLLGMSSDFIVNKDLIAIGVTLTGHDEIEPNASPNYKRILGLEMCKKSGFKTFASIEPIIDFDSSLEVVSQSAKHCDLFKIGLKSGGKYKAIELRNFYRTVNAIVSSKNPEAKIYWKDRLLKKAGIERKDLPPNCVNRGYNIFK